MPSDLKTATLHATKWATAFTLTMQVGRAVVHFLLAFLLGPETFGVAARVLAVGNILDMASEFGFIASLIQRKDLTPRHVSTAFVSNLALSLLMGILGFAGVRGFAAWSGGSEFLTIVQAVAPLPVVLALGHVPQALLTRNLDFRTQTLANLWGTFAYVLVSVGLAMIGFGAWSVLIGYYANFAVLSLLLWRRSGWTPRFEFGREELRDLLGFGAYHAGSKFLNALTRGLDVLLIGWRLGNGAAGIYAVGLRVGALAVGQVTNVFNTVLFSSFSRLQQDRPRLGSAYLRSTRILATLSAGLLAVAYAMVPALPRVLGAAWDEAAPVARILCLYAYFLAAGGTLQPPALSAIGRSDWSLWLAIIRVGIQVAALMVGMQFHLIAASVAMVVFQVAANLVSQRYVTTGIGVTMKQYLRAVRESLAGLVAAIAVVHAIEALHDADSLIALAARTALAVLLAAAVFAGVVHAIERSVWPEIRSLVRGIANTASERKDHPMDQGPAGEA